MAEEKTKLEDFRLMSKLGEGTFSQVLKVKHKKTGKIFAMKRFRKHFNGNDEIENLREIQALRRLNPHPHIIDLQEVIFDPSHGILCLTFDLMECNLYELISRRNQNIPESKAKMYLYQISKGMEFIHAKGIFHRDIKPENILISNDEIIKIADFGSCRSIHSKQPYTEYIATRWYRSPECLLCDGMYNYKMDVWGVGCVLFEIISKMPLFPGSDELDQLHRIHNVMGTPSQKLLKKMLGNKASAPKYQFAPKEGSGLRSLLSNISEDCLDLLKVLLAYDPDERVPTREILRHPFFRDVDLSSIQHALESTTRYSVTKSTTAKPPALPTTSNPAPIPVPTAQPNIIAPPATQAAMPMPLQVTIPQSSILSQTMGQLQPAQLQAPPPSQQIPQATNIPSSLPPMLTQPKRRQVISIIEPSSNNNNNDNTQSYLKSKQAGSYGNAPNSGGTSTKPRLSDGVQPTSSSSRRSGQGYHRRSIDQKQGQASTDQNSSSHRHHRHHHRHHRHHHNGEEGAKDTQQEHRHHSHHHSHHRHQQSSTMSATSSTSSVNSNSAYMRKHGYSNTQNPTSSEKHHSHHRHHHHHHHEPGHHSHHSRHSQHGAADTSTSTSNQRGMNQSFSPSATLNSYHAALAAQSKKSSVGGGSLPIGAGVNMNRSGYQKLPNINFSPQLSSIDKRHLENTRVNVPSSLVSGVSGGSSLYHQSKSVLPSLAHNKSQLPSILPSKLR